MIHLSGLILLGREEYSIKALDGQLVGECNEDSRVTARAVPWMRVWLERNLFMYF